MKHFILFVILFVVGASAQSLLFGKDDPEPYKGHALDIEDAGAQSTVMQPETAAMPVNLTYVVCPGRQVQCLDGQTCCKQSGGQWGCCPYPQAVCCADGIHCCPPRYSCGPPGVCNPPDLWMELFKKAPAKLETNPQNRDDSFVETSPVKQKIVCPGGRRQCFDGYCCPKPTGGYGCCSVSNPVCCPDGIHCCQRRTTCDQASQSCIYDDQIFKPFRKIPARQTP